MPMQPGKPVVVVVQAVVRGAHGWYVVTRPEPAVVWGTITFALDRRTWQGKKRPAPGDLVLLYDVHLHRDRKGRRMWRARSARPFGPADAQN